MTNFEDQLATNPAARDLNKYVELLLKGYAQFPIPVYAELARSDAYCRLRFEMKRRGMSNKSLAEVLGIHESAIARAFTHRTGLNRHWNQIAKAIQVEPDWLISGIHDFSTKPISAFMPWGGSSTPAITVQTDQFSKYSQIKNIVHVQHMGTLNANLDVDLSLSPRSLLFNSDGMLEVTEDLPNFQLSKGNFLLIRRGAAKVNGLTLVALKTGAILFGRAIEPDDSSSDSAKSISLLTNAGRMSRILQTDIEHTFIVTGILFERPDTLKG